MIFLLQTTCKEAPSTIYIHILDLLTPIKSFVLWNLMKFSYFYLALEPPQFLHLPGQGARGYEKSGKFMKNDLCVMKNDVFQEGHEKSWFHTIGSWKVMKNRYLQKFIQSHTQNFIFLVATYYENIAWIADPTLQKRPMS